MKQLIRNTLFVAVLTFTLFFSGQFAYAGNIEVNSTTFPDANFRRAVLEAAGIYDENIDAAVVDSSQIIRFSVDYPVETVKGIEYLDNLESLRLWKYNSKKLTVNNSKLNTLIVYSPKLSSLNINKLTNLETLGVNSSKIPKVDISKNKKLRVLTIYSAKLEAVSLKNADKLERLDISSDIIKTVDTTKNKKLRHIMISGKKATAKLGTLKNLEEIELRNIKASKLDLSKCSRLVAIALIDMPKLKSVKFNNGIYNNCRNLTINGSSMTSLDLGKFKEITTLNLSNNKKLKSVNLKKLKKLYYLRLSDTAISKLDISKNKALNYIYVGNTKISSLNLSKVDALYGIEFYGSKIKKLNLTKFENVTLYFNNVKKGTTLDLKNILEADLQVNYKSDDILGYSKGKISTDKNTKQGFGSVSLGNDKYKRNVSITYK